MVRSQIVLIVISAYLVLNGIASSYIFDCKGKNLVPNNQQIEKIELARKLFRREPRIHKPSELRYLIRITSCYNAWADKANNIIIISEPVISNFSTEELAGILGHEFGHFESWDEKEQSEIDAIGASVTSKSTMLKQLNKMIVSFNDIPGNNKIAMRTLILPNLIYWLTIQDFNLRINKIKSLPDNF